MNSITIFLLKALRKVYSKLYASDNIPFPISMSKVEISTFISSLLKNKKPCMIARYGGVELAVVLNYLSINKEKHSIFKYIKKEESEWWWDNKTLSTFLNNAGFFPATEKKAEQFSLLMLEDSKELDLIAMTPLVRQMCLQIKDIVEPIPRSNLLALEPWWVDNPWTKCLEGKKVLIISPFAKLIEEQYHNNRKYLFNNPDILPEFELHTIESVQSLGGVSHGYKDWFEALHYMESLMDQIKYDITIIGCGAYGFCLAAHAKRTGHKAIHLGGVLQLLFGIKGARWENPNYNAEYNYNTLFNDYWVKPDQYRPQNYKNVEDGCYW